MIVSWATNIGDFLRSFNIFKMFFLQSNGKNVFLTLFPRNINEIDVKIKYYGNLLRPKLEKVFASLYLAFDDANKHLY